MEKKSLMDRKAPNTNLLQASHFIGEETKTPCELVRDPGSDAQ